jgi:hypothetical protein
MLKELGMSYRVFCLFIICISSPLVGLAQIDVDFNSFISSKLPVQQDSLFHVLVSHKNESVPLVKRYLENWYKQRYEVNDNAVILAAALKDRALAPIIDKMSMGGLDLTCTYCCPIQVARYVYVIRGFISDTAERFHQKDDFISGHSTNLVEARNCKSLTTSRLIFIAGNPKASHESRYEVANELCCRLVEPRYLEEMYKILLHPLEPDESGEFYCEILWSIQRTEHYIAEKMIFK